MPELNDTPRKVKYITRSVPGPSTPVPELDTLIIRDDSGTVARFEQLRGDMDYIEFLAELLDVYENMYELEY